MEADKFVNLKKLYDCNFTTSGGKHAQTFFIGGYYRTAAGSFGLQAGAQSFGYAMFFLTNDALEYLEKSDGWEIGTGPSVVVADKGLASALTTTTAKDDIYVFFFDQQGLMAELGLQGSKITRFTPKQ